ncbi:MAG: hypothetical protein GY722_06270 [bacterium]|nr:hypothetical protein [bacterium]
MKTLNRTLLTLVVATAIALGWSWIARTDWAASASILGVGQDYDNAIQPILKVAAAIVVMVAATQLIQRATRFLLGSERRSTAGRSPSSAPHL